MMDQHPLPNDRQRAELGRLIQLAFVTIREFASEGKTQQTFDLADTFHNLPAEMYGIGKWDPVLFRHLLVDYRDRYAEHPVNFVDRFDEIFRR